MSIYTHILNVLKPVFQIRPLIVPLSRALHDDDAKKKWSRTIQADFLYIYERKYKKRNKKFKIISTISKKILEYDKFNK